MRHYVLLIIVYQNQNLITYAIFLKSWQCNFAAMSL